MKRVIFGLIATFAFLTFFSCEKEDSNSSNTNLIENNSLLRKGDVTIINENNVGYYHNEILRFVFDDLNTMTSEEINTKIATSNYTVLKMKEYCINNNLELPSDEELNAQFINDKNTSLESLISNNIFSLEQKNILAECFNSLKLIDNDITKNDLLVSILQNNLDKVRLHSESKGKTISIAIINQLIASDQLWIVEDKINFLNQNNTFAKGVRPSNGQILAADAKALGLSLIYGGWSPIGWAGSMFVGAGVSIGSYMGSPLWWPY